MPTESIRARTGGAVDWRYPDDCDECGESCKRTLLPDGHVVYVGDGYSDRCAALAADRVFATAGLAHYLTERGTPFEPFSDFHALSQAILGTARGADSEVLPASQAGPLNRFVTPPS